MFWCAITLVRSLTANGREHNGINPSLSLYINIRLKITIIQPIRDGYFLTTLNVDRLLVQQISSGTPTTSLKCEHARLFRRENSDAFNVRWWSSGYTLASHMSGVQIPAKPLALLTSSNKSKARVQCFHLVWTHRSNYARTRALSFKREWCDHEQNFVSFLSHL
ncbi:LOW QUALITY PROTEIN: hypothetical protein T265_13861 [Opisthorchis viverrini]|uniref:Uncharacterized protein n=1 Tax=Opisthorchis viverrini TaxID=6198 RepID=A0A074ZUN7_OPIVI|nr:LOW QUALITY PROTEIN: hypothetical protein T265_13861 [Opisthorchis viverrini]KER27095.1 LOW QUALITY PROTEIN: hypothetical protein T265_13861 [Opisthorchis viverrini]